MFYTCIDLCFTLTCGNRNFEIPIYTISEIHNICIKQSKNISSTMSDKYYFEYQQDFDVYWLRLNNESLDRPFASIEELNDIIYTQGEVALFNKQVVPQTRTSTVTNQACITRKVIYTKINQLNNLTIEINNTTYPLTNFLRCNRHENTSCELSIYTPSTKELSQYDKFKFQPDQLKQYKVITTLNNDIIVSPENMQFLKCAGDPHRNNFTKRHNLKNILQEARNIFIQQNIKQFDENNNEIKPSDRIKKIIPFIPKVMVHYDNKHEKIISITHDWYIGFSLVCNIFVSNMFYIYFKYVLYLFQICFIFVSNMFHICFIFISNMFYICFKYVSNMFCI